MREIKTIPAPPPGQEAVHTSPVDASSPEAIEARYQAMIAAREARDAEKAATKRTERQLQAIQDAEVLERLEAEHGDVATIETDKGLVVLRRATQPAYRALQAAMGKADKKTDDWVHLRNFVVPCLLHPDTVSFELILRDYPIILVRCATAISDLLGAETEANAKK
jgi:hypothetical protein